MNAKIAVGLVGVALLADPCFVSAGFQEFTIEYKVIPGPKAQGNVPERIITRMRGKRLREEMFARGEHTVILMNIKGDRQTVTLLNPESKMYFRSESRADEDLLRLLNMPRGDSDPCAGDPAYRCKKLGTGTFLGYKVIKWKITRNADGDSSVMWYAPKLGTYLKLIDDEIEQTAVHIDDKAPSSHLFEIPKGYKKMDLEQMMMQK